MTRNQDAIDTIKQQWLNEKPELSTEAMATLGRLKRCSVLYQPILDNLFTQFELSSWEFDVLATLRRSGKPYTLLPTQLFSSLMVTSGTMTHRLKTLEKKGLIKRVIGKEDARQKAVQLTEAGFQKTEDALPAHIENIENLLIDLSDNERKTLDRSLKKLLAILEHKHHEKDELRETLTDQSHGF